MGENRRELLLGDGPDPSDEEIRSWSEGLEKDRARIRAALGGASLVRPPAPGMKITPSSEMLAALGEILPDLTSGQAISDVAGMFVGRNAPPHLGSLLAQIPRTRNPSARWRLGEVFERSSSPKVAHLDAELASLVGDKQLGTSREMLAIALPKLKTELATATALTLLGSDPQINGHLLDGLVKAKATIPQDKLEALADDERAWVRRTASRQIERQRNT